MGCFSELDIHMQEQRCRREDHSYPSRTATLEYYLEDLTERLEELNGFRPHDPMHSLYDRYFYEDYLTHYYENPCTVQGLIKATDEVKRLIKKREIVQKESDRFISAVKATGADPNGQLVIIGLFVPSLSESAVPA